MCTKCSDSDPRPAVDDAFWFGLSKTFVADAAAKQIEAAGRVQTFIGWLWTVFVAASAVTAIASPADKNRLQAAEYLFVTMLLIVAYWFAIHVQSPVLVAFDPRSPEDIQDAHQESFLNRRRSLRLAVGVTAFATVTMCVVFGTGVAPMTGYQAPEAIVVSAVPPVVAVEAVLPDVRAVLASFTSAAPSKLPKQDVMFHVRSDGHVFAAAHLFAQADSVTFTWADKSGARWQVVRDLRRDLEGHIAH